MVRLWEVGTKCITMPWITRSSRCSCCKSKSLAGNIRALREYRFENSATRSLPKISISNSAKDTKCSEALFTKKTKVEEYEELTQEISAHEFNCADQLFNRTVRPRTKNPLLQECYGDF